MSGVDDQEGTKVNKSSKRRCCAHCISRFLDVLMCNTRYRRRARQRSAWVTKHFDAKYTRQIELQEKYQMAYNLTVEVIKHDPDIGKWRRAYRLFALALQSSYRSVFAGCLRRSDQKTGLPRRMLERFQIMSFAREGPHGFVFKAQACGRGYKPPRPQDLCYAMRIRDKARGRVVQMPLVRAKSVIRRDILWGGGQFRYVRQALRLCGVPQVTKFRHDALCVQKAIYNSYGYFIEITEWLSGPSLERYLEELRVPLDEFQACRIVVRILSALKYMHERCLVHRDVRSAQILFAEKGVIDSVKLCDFWCVARFPRKKGFFHEDSIPVDVYRAAPEVLRFGSWSPKADVWSAACLLFEILQGHPPFGGHGAALVDRICHGRIEFDKTCGSVSEGAHQLLLSLFKRRMGNRPTAAEAMDHPWAQTHSVDKPPYSVKTEGQHIKGVQLVGKPPMARRGFEASKLLEAGTGLMQAGFCTFMGITQCHMDFEIIGKAHWQEYWVTQVLISLWGNHDNPKYIVLQVRARDGAPWVDVVTHRVEKFTSSEARLEVHRPMRWVRLSFRGNHGGAHGISMRKIAFYGYECRAVECVVEQAQAYCQRGSEIHVHNEKILEKMILGHQVTKAETLVEKTHPSLHADILKSLGRRVPGANHRYRVYRDLKSGKPHHSSNVQIYLKPPPGNVLCASVLGLRYVSTHPPEQKAPLVRIDVVHGSREDRMERVTLFQTESLNRPNWYPKEILASGYTDHPYMYASGLEISTDHTISVEIIFENYSGYIHVPLNLGLTFFYIPLLDTPSEAGSSAVDAAEEMLAARMGRRQGFADNSKEMTVMELTQQRRVMASKEKNREVGIMSDDDSDVEQTPAKWEAKGEEAELQADMRELELITAYGNFGVAQPEAIDIGAWRPTQVEADDMFQDPDDKAGSTMDEQWWEARSSEEESAGWQEGSAVGSASSAEGDDWGGTKGRRRRAVQGSDEDVTFAVAQHNKVETVMDKADRLADEMRTKVSDKIQTYHERRKERHAALEERRRRRQAGLPTSDSEEGSDEDDDDDDDDDGKEEAVPDDEGRASPKKRNKAALKEEEPEEPVQWCGVTPPPALVACSNRIPGVPACAQGLPNARATCARGMAIVPKVAALPLVLCGFTPSAPPPSPREARKGQLPGPPPGPPPKAILKKAEKKALDEADKSLGPDVVGLQLDAQESGD